MSVADIASERRTAAGEPLVAVILVNWNAWRDVIKASQSLQASTYARWNLIVVDNASSDGSLDRLSVLEDRTRLIANPINSGFAGGCNIGFAEARRLGADYVFLLNCDAWVEPDCLAALVSTAGKLRNAAVLGAVVKSAEGDHLQFFGSRCSSDWGRPAWFQAPEDLKELESALIETDFVFGAALFAPMSLLETVGDFDERFFLNFEETDWCYRARGLGFGCTVVRDAVVRHKGGASLGPGEGPLQTYFLQRNQLLFAEKHGSFRQWSRTLRGTLKFLLSRLAGDLRAWSARGGGFAEPTKSLLLAVRDYVFRRFGDCPPALRGWAKQFAQRASRSALPT